MRRSRTKLSFAVCLTVGLTVSLTGCSEPSSEAPVAAWETVLEGTPGALLRVSGSDSLGVYAVGADADGQGPLVYRIQGKQAERLETGARGSLWWFAQISEDELQMVGDDGLVLRHRPSAGSFERIESSTSKRLFGVWSATPREVWYVGGDLGASTGVVLHGTDDMLGAPKTLDPNALDAAFFKVQGFAHDAVWMVGQAGRAVFFDGTSFSDESAATPLPLLSVSGVDAQHVFAVGGAAGGVILRREGDAWIDETPSGLPQMISVWATSREHAIAVGFNGHMYERRDGTWQAFEPAPPTYQDLHSVWVDAKGGVWIAGGQLASDPPTNGVLLHYEPLRQGG